MDEGVRKGTASEYHMYGHEFFEFWYDDSYLVMLAMPPLHGRCCCCIKILDDGPVS